jgi:hypothetical protein
MKHLKRFNESKVLDQSVIDECKDILLELEDIGIKTNINSYLSYNDINPRNKGLKSWIQFYFSRKEDFDYSDIEDVVERLKSFLSEYELKIEWMSPMERSEQRPTIKTTRVINPMTFTPEGVKTQCELHFN